MNTSEVKGRSLWSDARRRFFQNKAAVAGMIALTIIILISFIGPFFAVWSFEEIDWNTMGSAATLGKPSFETGHFFGTDDLGRDLYSRVLQGTRISLKVGIIGAGIAVVVGTIYGTVAGYVGGRTDQIMMRIVDVLMSIPFMFVLILLLVIFGRSETMIFIGIGMLAWLDMSRIVRGQTLTLK
ncbi:MAG: ABC transporter permease subunit, partial [Rhodobacteraceae bacterium]|nr:ABC transporter permease subunit [Paracoccaceae bacterium]